VVGAIGAVTAIAFAGANLLAYKKRCVICGLSSAEAQQVTAPATVKQANALGPSAQQKRVPASEPTPHSDLGTQNGLVRGVGWMFGCLIALPYYAAKWLIRKVRE
jgi:hypothetical protein